MSNMDFKHRKDGMMVLNNIDEDSEVDSSNDNNNKKNDGSNKDVTPTKEAVIIDDASESDEEKSEKIQLIELHDHRNDNGSYTNGKDDEIDMDIEKKNALRCTW
eukprot:CAMPEP_0201591406 /NCGR_PEP_ID=MMETSP0190_2-20130828/189053_1 /ASSEMBLY_ACC=CAM_ASM_000263 /TAXON_ID=37353 /ORGANISM="Rosalina sp." /LENGTH=103 /DNA_ID=CAMNT_0048049639 /DNA_START=33 /DNA_END=341 /DNA_ORIENTATION=+